MPKGTRVDKMYEALKGKGMPVKDAVRIAQSKTGQALATGRPPKHATMRQKALDKAFHKGG